MLHHLLLSLLLLGFIAKDVFAEDSNTKLPPLKTTEQLAEQVCSFLKSQTSFSLEMDITYDDVLDSGAKVQYSAYQKILVNKPNRLYSEYVGDERLTNFYYDGQSFTIFAPDSNYYFTGAASDSLDKLLQKFEERRAVTIPMSNLVVSDPCAKMKADVGKIIFIGQDMVEREPMYHLLLLGQERDIQIWVTQQEPPLLKKAIITYKNLPSSPQYTVRFSQWNFQPQTLSDNFTFTPPQGAVIIELLPEE
jgi:hypothetical protein